MKGFNNKAWEIICHTSVIKNVFQFFDGWFHHPSEKHQVIWGTFRCQKWPCNFLQTSAYGWLRLTGTGPGCEAITGFFLGQFAIAYYWVTYRLSYWPGCTGVTKYTISQIGIVYYWQNSRQWFSIVLVYCVIHYIMREPCIWTYREMSDISRNE